MRKIKKEKILPQFDVIFDESREKRRKWKNLWKNETDE
jgi:hypothetical protein